MSFISSNQYPIQSNLSHVLQTERNEKEAQFFELTSKGAHAPAEKIVNAVTSLFFELYQSSSLITEESETTHPLVDRLIDYLHQLNDDTIVLGSIRFLVDSSEDPSRLVGDITNTCSTQGLMKPMILLYSYLKDLSNDDDVKEQFEGVIQSAKNEYQCLFFDAIAANDVGSIKSYLNDNFIDVNLKNERGHTPLYCYIVGEHECDLEVLETFLNHPSIDPSMTDDLGNGYLFLATLVEKLNVVQCLLNHPRHQDIMIKSMSSVNKNGYHSIHMALANSSKEIFKELLIHRDDHLVTFLLADFFLEKVKIYQRFSLEPSIDENKCEIDCNRVETARFSHISMIRSLEKYVSKLSKDEKVEYPEAQKKNTWEVVLDVFKNSLIKHQQLFTNSDAVDKDEFIHFLSTHSLAIPTSWKDEMNISHSTGCCIDLSQKILIKSNRGYLSTEPGLEVFHIHNEENIEKVIAGLYSNRLQAQYFLSDVDALLELEPLYTLEQKQQRVDNCTWTSAAKGNLRSILFMTILKYADTEEDAQRISKEFYKDWSKKFDRNATKKSFEKKAEVIKKIANMSFTEDEINGWIDHPKKLHLAADFDDIGYSKVKRDLRNLRDHPEEFEQFRSLFEKEVSFIEAIKKNYPKLYTDF